MSKQAILEKIEQRVRVTPPVVTLALKDWQLIEDMILELSSPKLLKSIAKARRDYKTGKIFIDNLLSAGRLLKERLAR